MAGKISVVICVFACLLIFLSLYHKYFESGVFKGFFKSCGTVLFTPLLEPLIFQNIHDIAIYSDWDIEACLNYRVLGNSGIFSSVSY